MKFLKALFSIIYILSQFISSMRNRIKLWAEGVEYTETPVINGRIQIHNKGQIIIGKGVKLNCNSLSNPVGLPHPVILCTQNQMAKIEIGNNVGISGSSLVAATSITIGNNVMIGGGCGIWDTDFHLMDPEMRKIHPTRDATTAPIFIEEDVFIGAKSIVLKGVTIGKGAIIAAGTVVNKSVPANSLAYGNPMLIKLKNK